MLAPTYILLNMGKVFDFMSADAREKGQKRRQIGC